jgi:hypothetical protein
LAARRDSVDGHLAKFNATMQFNTAKWEEACRRQEAGKAIDKATTAWQVQYSSNLSYYVHREATRS